MGLKETVKKDASSIAEGDGKVWLENSLQRCFEEDAQEVAEQELGKLLSKSYSSHLTRTDRESIATALEIKELLKKQYLTPSVQ